MDNQPPGQNVEANNLAAAWRDEGVVLPSSQAEANPTPPSSTNVFKYGGITVGVIVALMVLFDMLGTSSSDYDFVNTLNGFSGMMSFPLAAILGYMAASGILRPRNSPKRSLLRYALATVGFVAGFVPGIILAVILTFPLSEHACTLSGSKSC